MRDPSEIAPSARFDLVESARSCLPFPQRSGLRREAASRLVGLIPTARPADTESGDGLVRVDGHAGLDSEGKMASTSHETTPPGEAALAALRRQVVALQRVSSLG